MFLSSLFYHKFNSFSKSTGTTANLPTVNSFSHHFLSIFYTQECMQLFFQKTIYNSIFWLFPNFVTQSLLTEFKGSDLVVWSCGTLLMFGAFSTIVSPFYVDTSYSYNLVSTLGVIYVNFLDILQLCCST